MQDQLSDAVIRIARDLQKVGAELDWSSRLREQVEKAAGELEELAVGMTCDRCGKAPPLPEMTMGAAEDAGWFFNPPTGAPDCPDSYCPDCARFLAWAFTTVPSERCQPCGICRRVTPVSQIKADMCLICLFNSGLGHARRANELERQLQALRKAPEEDPLWESIRQMSRAEVDEELRAEGIDPDALTARLKAKLGELREQR